MYEIREGVPLVRDKPAVQPKERRVDYDTHQPRENERERHSAKRDHAHERIRERHHKRIRGTTRAHDYDDGKPNHGHEAQRRIRRDQSRYGRHRDGVGPAGRLQRPKEKVQRHHRKHELQHRGREDTPRPPHGIGKDEEARALHQHEPHDAAAPALARHTTVERGGFDFRDESIRQNCQQPQGNWPQ